MTRTKYEKLIARFRHMMVNSGVVSADTTNVELLNKFVKGKTFDEKMHSMEMVTSLVSESYWQSQGE
jgi:hypothetical protein